MFYHKDPKPDFRENFKSSISFVECPPGHFGTECMGNCSGNCINNTECDPINGECSDGCIDGYIGRRCENCKLNVTHYMHLRIYLRFE